MHSTGGGSLFCLLACASVNGTRCSHKLQCLIEERWALGRSGKEPGAGNALTLWLANGELRESTPCRYHVGKEESPSLVLPSQRYAGTGQEEMI